jgi:hypothetical protein
LAVLWTIITVVLVVLCLALIVGLPMFPGRKRMGDVQEQGFRLRSGLWKKEDADRLR